MQKYTKIVGKLPLKACLETLMAFIKKKANYFSSIFCLTNKILCKKSNLCQVAPFPENQYLTKLIMTKLE